VPLKPGATVTERVVRRRAGASAAAAAAALPPPVPPPRPDDPRAALRAAVLLSSEQFDAVKYLVHVHKDTDVGSLRRGLERLRADAAVHVEDIQTLVKDNFERFISCKTTIDDVLTTLRRAEGVPPGAAGVAQPTAGKSRKAAGGSGGGHFPTPEQGQTQKMHDSVKAVQKEANKVLGPLLERQSQLDGVRSVLALLRRHKALFGLPARLRAAAERGDVHGALREWKAARALVGPHEAPLMHRLLAVAEREVNALERGLRWILSAPGSTLGAAVMAAELVLEIVGVRLGGAGGADASGAASAAPTSSSVAAKELVLAFVSGRAAKLGTAVTSAVATMDAALEKRQQMAVRRAAEATQQAGGAPSDGAASSDVSASTKLGRTSSATLDKALQALHGTSASAAAVAASAVAAASAEVAAEKRFACVRTCCAATLVCLPDAWRFAASITGGTSSSGQAAGNSGGGRNSMDGNPLLGGGGMNPLHRRTASAGSVLEAGGPRAGLSPPPAQLDPPVEAVLKKATEMLCAQLKADMGSLREGHLRSALSDVARVARSMGDLGAPECVYSQLEALRKWGLKQLVADLCSRMQHEAASAAGNPDDAAALGADVAAAWALLSLSGDGHGGMLGDDEGDESQPHHTAVRQLRVSVRPLAFSAGLARAMSALVSVATEGGAAGITAVCGASSEAFFACFHAFADALATRAEEAGVVNRDGSPPEEGDSGSADGKASGWQNAAMTLLADSAFVRLWVLPALTSRFQMAWAVPVPTTGAPPNVAALAAEAEDVLGALEEHVLSGYTQRHALAMTPLCSSYFDGDSAATTPGRSLWPQWAPVIGVRDITLTFLDALVSAHAVAHARAGPFTDGVLGALATAAVQQLVACGRTSTALTTPCMSGNGYCQLALEIAFLKHVLRGYAPEEQASAWEALSGAAMDCAVAAAKQQAAAAGKTAFSRTATRASLGAAAQEVVGKLLPHELERTAMHTRCFPAGDEVDVRHAAAGGEDAAAPQAVIPEASAGDAPAKVKKKKKRKVLLEAE
jgi:hypothetical protein